MSGVAEHSIIDMSTPPDDENGLDTSLWCACECGWSAGPFEDELFAAEAYADHKSDALHDVIARATDVLAEHFGHGDAMYNPHALEALAILRGADDCTHESLTGVDGTDVMDPDKVWRCDSCGWTGVTPWEAI